MTVTARHLAVAVVLAACGLAGCLGGDDGTKAGVARGPVTLQLAADDPPDRPASAQIVGLRPPGPCVSRTASCGSSRS